jgi:hypothetical protein
MQRFFDWPSVTKSGGGETELRNNVMVLFPWRVTASDTGIRLNYLVNSRDFPFAEKIFNDYVISGHWIM